MSKDKYKLIPELRFPEFVEDGEWVEKKLGDKEVSYFVNEKTSVNKLNIDSYISTENILPEFLGVSTSSKLPSLGSFTKFKNGDILISNIRPYLKKVWKADKIGGASNDVLIFRSGSEVLSEFLECIIKNDVFINYVMESAKGVKMPRGDKDSMQKYIVFIPSKKEQQRIASCLSSLDEVIAAHSQKLDLLKDHKKGLMQNLFPQEGERVPKYRFPEFLEEGDWVEKKLGEMTLKVGSGSTPLGGESVYKKNGRPFVRSQNVGWGIFLIENIAFIDEETHKNSSNTEIEIDDVLLNITGASIGRSVVANKLVAGGNVNQHVCIIRTKRKNLNPFFLCQYIISAFGQKQIDSFQAGGNRQGLNFAQIRSLTIPIPLTLQEQQKIASCLSSLDDLITAQAEKIAQLKLHKMGLMQGLFPKINE